MNWIQPLDQLTLADTDKVGGKAAHLGAMLRAGFSVPEGFVINVDAFVDHFGQVTDPLVRPPPPKLQTEFMAEVVAALMQHLGSEANVAVRSSSTEEDSNFASFAGQHSTYYFVPPSRIDQAILDCWMSLWSPAALAYRRAGWAAIESGEPLRMAVIVQRMLPATRSGVIFSKDPLGQSEEAVLEACWGLGAALVDGRVNPDRARFGEDAQLLSYRVGEKKFQVQASPQNPDASRLQELSRSQQLAAVLQPDEAEHIANSALQLQTLFDAPQDIEWSYVGKQLYFLQSRPVTTGQGEYQGDQQLVLFKPIAENFTEPLTPLSEDLYAQALPDIGTFVQGRLYIRLSLVRWLIPWQMDDAALANMLLLRGQQPPPRFAPGPTLRALAMLSLAFLADGANWIRAARVQPGDLQRFVAVAQRLRQAELPLVETMRRLVWATHSFVPAYRQMFTLNISAGRYFIYISMLEYLVKRFAPDYPIEQLAKIYHGRGDIQSVQMLAELQQLSAQLHTDADLRDALLANLAALSGSGPGHLPTGHPFTVAFESFMQRYGHRGPRELDLSAPRWSETPGELLKLLGADQPDYRDFNAGYGEHLAARDELHRHLRPWQRKLVDYFATATARFIALRENTRHYHVLAFTRMRERILEMTQPLVLAGDLKLAQDAFFLRADELEALAREQLPADTAQTLVRQRRRQWRLRARQGATETFNIDMPTAAEGGANTATCASAGIVEGAVRFVHNPNQGTHLQAGDILVAPYTDPAWTPLFCRAGGVIVGTGSYLSHAGTVARELHLPCIVEATHIITRLVEGQRVRLNATQGTVEVL